MTQSHLKQIVHAHFEECDDVFLCMCHTSVCLFLFYQGFYGGFVGTFDNGCFVLLFPTVDRLLIIDILDRGARRCFPFQPSKHTSSSDVSLFME